MSHLGTIASPVATVKRGPKLFLTSRVAPVGGGGISITAEADPAARRDATEAEEKLEEQLREGRRLREERSRALLVLYSKLRFIESSCALCLD